MPGTGFARRLANSRFGRFVRPIRPKADQGQIKNDLDQCRSISMSDVCGESVADSVILA
jgi:hypothetical protein